MCMQNFIKIYQKVQETRPVSLFFRICTSAKPRPIPNVIWQFLWLHLVNINVHAKFHHNIPLCSRDRAIFTFSEFGARQSLDQNKCHFTISSARSCQYQCVCKSVSKFSKRFKRYGHVSLFVPGQNRYKLSGEKKIKSLIIGHTLKVSLQLRLTFFGSGNSLPSRSRLVWPLLTKV